MSVTLPTGFIGEATPRLIDRGDVMTPVFIGVDQRLDRLGAKWGVDFRLTPMKGDDARVWIARLIRGRKEKALIQFPQPGVSINMLANWNTSGVHAANVETLNVTSNVGTQLGKTFLEGQFISINQNVSGVLWRELYQVTADTPVVGAVAPFTAAIPIQPPLRTSLTAAARTVNGPAANVMIEGYVKGDQSQWTIDNAKIYGLEFSIEEAR